MDAEVEKRSEMKRKLRSADARKEDEIEALQQQVATLKREGEERKRALEEEARRKSELKRRARAADEKEREIAALQDQLTQLQVRARDARLSHVCVSPTSFFVCRKPTLASRTNCGTKISS